jgi:hypothetical protein
VIIDGSFHQMTYVNTNASGQALFQYTTVISTTSPHIFAFSFSNPSGSGTVTLPTNRPFSGPEVYPFALVNISVPDSVLFNTPAVYSVTYTSPSNTGPVLTDIDIDGRAHDMQQTSTSGNFVSGVTYAYTATHLAMGQHYYRFRFSDGSAQAIYQGDEHPHVSTLILSGSGVSPASGITTTAFTFSTTYQEVSGKAPGSAYVYVDSTPYPLTYVSGSFGTGALYQATTTLPAGNHTFTFLFSDAYTWWSDPFGSDVYGGPTVGAGLAVPAATRRETLHTTSYDLDPDQEQPLSFGP